VLYEFHTKPTILIMTVHRQPKEDLTRLLDLNTHIKVSLLF